MSGRFLLVDMVNHPPHYNRGGVEVLDFIEAFAADDYHIGNVLKYCARYRFKGSPVEDLKKARFYLERKIAMLEAEND